jgi:ubiquinone biosynthesis protein
MGKVILLLKTIRISLFEGIKYLFTKNYPNLIRNLAKKLSKVNILYIKLIQSISINENITDEVLIEELKEYTTNVSYENDEINYKLLENMEKIELLENKKLKIDKKLPINAGMTALVFEGEIGVKKVIIKILRNNLKEKLEKSFKELEFVSKFYSKLPYIRKLNIKTVLKENKKLILDQTDMKKEMKSIKLFQEKWKNIDYIQIPDIFPEYTNILSDGIVMEYIDGKTINEIGEDNREKYAYMLAKFKFKSLFYDSVYHADLHQGNILFLNDNNKEELKLGIIDYGIIGELDREEQNDYFSFIKNLLNKEYEEIVCNEHEKFIKPLDIYNNLSVNKKKIMNNKLIEELRIVNEIDKIMGYKQLYRINSILKDYNLELKDSFCKMEVALAVAEGVCKNLSKDKGFMDYVNDAYKEFFPDFMLD